MPHYLDTLSRFVADTTFESLPPSAIAAARDVTLDTLGAIAAGMLEPENQRLAAWTAENMAPAESTIIATHLRASAMGAALVNATAGVALEMDEGNRFGGGHPAIHVLPGLLAVAERDGASGADFLTALVVGYEVTSRLGGATVARPNVHSHGHWGAPGTAAAIAKLRGMDASDIRAVINVAASMSPANTWTNAFAGATVRNLYPGRSSMQGVMAVALYECGFTALDDAPSDVYGTILGDSFDGEAAVAGLGDECRIEQNYFKLHACCRYNHATLDGVQDAAASARLSPDAVDDIDSVAVSVPWMLDGMLGDYPQNMLAAKFNLRYAVAAALATGRTDITVFRTDSIADPTIRALFDRVSVQIGDAPQRQSVRNPSASVEIRLRNGAVSRSRVRTIRGDYGKRIPRSEIEDKFQYLATPALGPQRTRQALTHIEALQDCTDIRGFVEGIFDAEAQQ